MSATTDPQQPPIIAADATAEPHTSTSTPTAADAPVTGTTDPPPHSDASDTGGTQSRSPDDVTNSGDASSESNCTTTTPSTACEQPSHSKLLSQPEPEPQTLTQPELPTQTQPETQTQTQLQEPHTQTQSQSQPESSPETQAKAPTQQEAAPVRRVPISTGRPRRDAFYNGVPLVLDDQGNIIWVPPPPTVAVRAVSASPSPRAHPPLPIVRRFTPPVPVSRAASASASASAKRDTGDDEVSSGDDADDDDDDDVNGSYPASSAGGPDSVFFNGPASVPVTSAFSPLAMGYSADMEGGGGAGGRSGGGRHRANNRRNPAPVKGTALRTETTSPPLPMITTNSGTTPPLPTITSTTTATCVSARRGSASTPDPEFFSPAPPDSSTMGMGMSEPARKPKPSGFASEGSPVRGKTPTPKKSLGASTAEPPTTTTTTSTSTTTKTSVSTTSTTEPTLQKSPRDLKTSSPVANTKTLTKSSSFVMEIDVNKPPDSHCAFLKPTWPSDFYSSDHSFKGKLKPSARFHIAFVDTKGRRARMEDVVTIIGGYRDNQEDDLIGLYDGHNGSMAAAYIADLLDKEICKSLDTSEDIHKILHTSFMEVNSALLEDEIITGGSTALVALLRKDTGYIANVGDSRAILVNTDKTFQRLSVDHRPDDPLEAEYVKQHGGQITEAVEGGKSVLRVNTQLTLTRAFGDRELSTFLRCEPHIATFPVNDPAKSRWLVMACDGLWDFVPEEEVASIVHKSVNPIIAALELRKTALVNASGDNVSIVIIDFMRRSSTAMTFVGGKLTPERFNQTKVDEYTAPQARIFLNLFSVQEFSQLFHHYYSLTRLKGRGSKMFNNSQMEAVEEKVTKLANSPDVTTFEVKKFLKGLVYDRLRYALFREWRRENSYESESPQSQKQSESSGSDESSSTDDEDDDNDENTPEKPSAAAVPPSVHTKKSSESTTASTNPKSGAPPVPSSIPGKDSGMGGVCLAYMPSHADKAPAVFQPYLIYPPASVCSGSSSDQESSSDHSSPNSTYPPWYQPGGVVYVPYPVEVQYLPNSEPSTPPEPSSPSSDHTHTPHPLLMEGEPAPQLNTTSVTSTTKTIAKQIDAPVATSIPLDTPSTSIMSWGFMYPEVPRKSGFPERITEEYKPEKAQRKPTRTRKSTGSKTKQVGVVVPATTKNTEPEAQAPIKKKCRKQRNPQNNADAPLTSFPISLPPPPPHPSLGSPTSQQHSSFSVPHAGFAPQHLLAPSESIPMSFNHLVDASTALYNSQQKKVPNQHQAELPCLLQPLPHSPQRYQHQHYQNQQQPISPRQPTPPQSPSSPQTPFSSLSSPILGMHSPPSALNAISSSTTTSTKPVNKNAPRSTVIGTGSSASSYQSPTSVRANNSSSRQPHHRRSLQCVIITESSRRACAE
ncbi:Protein phosphatase 2C 1 [Pelomyxa schiedti]|nr:Protein phosphatase 2C 1 [Pelomyxa schiedti]